MSISGQASVLAGVSLYAFLIRLGLSIGQHFNFNRRMWIVLFGFLWVTWYAFLYRLFLWRPKGDR